MSCAKIRYRTEADALAFMNKLNKTAKNKRSPQSAYLCPKCNTWHLTSQSYTEFELHQVESFRGQVKALAKKMDILENIVKQNKIKIAELKKALYQANITNPNIKITRHVNNLIKLKVA